MHTNKYIEHVASKSTTTSMREKWDRQVCEHTHNNVYTIHRQQCVYK